MSYLPNVSDITSHGYPILAVKYDDSTHPEEGVLLCIRPGDTFQPFVVWRFVTAGNGSCFSGGYYADQAEALADFGARKF